MKLIEIKLKYDCQARKLEEIVPADFVAELIDDVIEDYPVANELDIHSGIVQKIDDLIFNAAYDLYIQEALKQEMSTGTGSCRKYAAYTGIYTKLVMDLKKLGLIVLESDESKQTSAPSFTRVSSAATLDWEAVSELNDFQFSWVDDKNTLNEFWEDWRARISFLDWDDLVYLSQYTNRLPKLWQPKITAWAVMQYSFVDKVDICARKSRFNIPNLEALSQQLIAQANRFNALCNKKEPQTDANLRLGHQELKGFINQLKPFWHFLSVLNTKGHYKYGSLDWPYEYLPRFYWLFPELNVFIDLFIKECSRAATPQQYLGHTLTWASLRTIHQQLTPLRAQIKYKDYSHYGWNSDLAEICDEMLLQIDHFASWFAEEKVRQHSFQDSHPAARRATQDLEYLVKVIRMHGDHIFPRLSSGLHGLSPFMDQVFKERELALMATRKQYNAAVLAYYETSEDAQKAAAKAEKQARSLQTQQEEAAKLIAIKEAACLETLKDIGILIDPTYAEEPLNAVVSQNIQGIIQAEENLRLARVASSCSAETKQEASPKASAAIFLPKMMTEQLLERGSLEKMLEVLKHLHNVLKWQDCRFIGMTKAEWERQDLVSDLQTLLTSISAMQGKQRPEEQEESLRLANATLAQVIHKLKTSEALFAAQSVPDHKKITTLQKYTNLFFRIYENRLLTHVMIAQRKYLDLKARQQLIEQGLSEAKDAPRQGAIRFFEMHHRNPLSAAETAEAALRAIHALLSQNLKAPCPGAHAAKIHQTILQKILETLAPAQPRLGLHDLAHF